MGVGDEILVAGEARHLQENDREHRRIVVVDRHNRPRWHPVWEGNPRIVRPDTVRADERVLHLQNAAQTRPYIDWHRMRGEFARVFPGRTFTTRNIRDPRLPWRFTAHRCKRGEIYIKRLPRGGYVVIEPHNKTSVAPNRQWGWRRWQAVVDALDVDWLQINPGGMDVLRGVCHQPASTFLEACRILSGAALYVGPEGGLYHAAAALGVRSVAIFGGYVSPDNQGYTDCVNLFEPMDGQSPCGQRVPCPHCEAALARITPEAVIGHVERMLGA